MITENSVCIYDFCGSAHWLNLSCVSMSADWYPEEKITVFSGMWGDVPDMPSPKEPSEKQVTDWVVKSGCHWTRRIAAHNAREAAHDKRMAQIDRMKKRRVSVSFRKPNGEAFTLENQSCGILSDLDMLRNAVAYMLKNLPPGSTLVSHKFNP